MAGVSQGASEAGGHVIGVTCEEIRQLRGSRANPYVQEEWLCPTLDIRLKKLMETSHAAIALPGGPGTLTEISLMWNRMIIKTLPIKPLILVGSGWKATFSALFKELSGYINPEDMRLLSYTPDVQGAVDKLNKLFEPGK
jgi:hypothetical protein